MEINQYQKLRIVVFTALVFTGTWMIPLSEMNSILFPDVMIGIPTASADSHLGILGQAAPELKLNTWIDGNGKKIAPIQLSDYRGKVVYLYFFQDW